MFTAQYELNLNVQLKYSVSFKSSVPWLTRLVADVHHGGPSSISGNSLRGTGTGVFLVRRFSPVSKIRSTRLLQHSTVFGRSAGKWTDSAEQSAFFRAANVTARRHDIRVQGFRTWQAVTQIRKCRTFASKNHNSGSHIQPLQSTNNFSILSVYTVTTVNLAAVTPVYAKRIWWSTGAAPQILKLGTRWWPVSLQTRLLGPRHPPNRKLGRPERSGEGKYACPVKKSNPESFSQQPSHIPTEMCRVSN